MRSRAVLAAGLALAAAGGGVASGAEGEGQGRIWGILSAPFRKSQSSDVPGHLKAGAQTAQRRARLSPFTVPVQGAEDMPAVKGGGKGALLNVTAGREFLDQSEAALTRSEQALGAQPLDAMDKELGALDKRLTETVLSDRDQRLRAQQISERVRALRRRVEIRSAFAQRNLRVSFIICSPDGRSLAVVNRRILREGEEIIPGLVVARIETGTVVFRMENEEMSLQLQ